MQRTPKRTNMTTITVLILLAAWVTCFLLLTLNLQRVRVRTLRLKPSLGLLRLLIQFMASCVTITGTISLRLPTFPEILPSCCHKNVFSVRQNSFLRKLHGVPMASCPHWHCVNPTVPYITAIVRCPIGKPLRII